MTPPRLIGISGYSRSGKTTAAQAVHEIGEYGIREFKGALQQVLLAQNPIVHRGIDYTVRLADVIQDLGWDGAKDQYPEVRRLMIDLGTKGCRDVIGEDIWVDATFRTIDADAKIVFTDCRFPNEAQRVKDHDGIVVRIDRPGVQPIGGVTDTALDEWAFDWRIANDGTVADLRRQVMVMLDVFDTEKGADLQPSLAVAPYSAHNIVVVPHGTTVVESTAVSNIEILTEECASQRYLGLLNTRPLKTHLQWWQEHVQGHSRELDRTFRRVDL